MISKHDVKITFLGTGTSQGIPIIGSTHPVCLSSDPKDKRLRVSVLLEWEEYTYVIDCGPDFRQQMLQSDVRKLDGILFTHEHADHTMGLDDIRPFFFRQGSIPIYAHPRVIESLSKRFYYILSNENKYPGAPSVEIQSIDKHSPFTIGNKKVIPIEALHHKLPVLGFRIENFVYLTDVKTIAEEEIKKLNDVDILVVNALRIETHISHFNLAEALEFVDRIGPKRAYFTHISHLLGFHQEVQDTLPENVYLAYDMLQLET